MAENFAECQMGGRVGFLFGVLCFGFFFFMFSTLVA